MDFEKIAKLGFGLMRLPKVGDDIDTCEAIKMVDTFMERGLLF